MENTDFVIKLKAARTLLVKTIAAFERRDTAFLKQCAFSYQEIFRDLEYAIEQHPELIEQLHSVYKEKAEDSLNAAAEKVLKVLSSAIPSAGDDFVKVMDAIIEGIETT